MENYKEDIGRWTDSYSLQTKELTAVNLKLDQITTNCVASEKEAKGLTEQLLMSEE